ncbi:SEC-C metal-binding domain-containing protein [Virgibacillus halodenitrificans]|uniref:SEC-C metal-binding domain-containing protein n=1 Tax=Virgibacillus halodenitrificans TaxID=1482 RepID=UPI0007618155
MNEDKQWKEINSKQILKEGLANYSKDELTEIRKFLNIKNASSLKKADLIDLLDETIPESLQEVCQIWDKERFQLLQTIAKNGGFIPAPELEPEQYSYLRATGFVFTGTNNGKKILAVPTDIIEQIKSLQTNFQIKAAIKRNTEWIQLTHGLLYFYGTLKIYHLAEMLKEYTGESIHIDDYLEVIFDANEYYDELQLGTSGLSYWRVEDPESVLREHEMRKDVPYYPFTKKQVLQAAEPGYVEKNQMYKQLVAHILKNFEVDRDEAETIVADGVDFIQEGVGPNEVIHYFNDIFEADSKKQLQAMIDKVSRLMNHTRQWDLKGHMPIELSNVDRSILRQLPNYEGHSNPAEAQVKVGRNDPCPCGSGKKYKKCCLNK